MNLSAHCVFILVTLYNTSSLSHLQEPLYPGLGCGGSRAYRGTRGQSRNTPLIGRQFIARHHAHTKSHSFTQLGEVFFLACSWEVGGNQQTVWKRAIVA